MRLKYVFFVVFSLLLLISCSEQKTNHVNLKIIQTTDVHGTIFPFDFIKKKNVSNSLANVYSFVKSTRENNPGRVILLDNGDFLQGQPSVYYYNFEDTISNHLGADVFNFMEYDAATVGNHDLETGHRVYDKFRKQLKAPYLAANAVNSSTGEPYFQPYTIIQKQGIKIAVLGLITPGIPNWLPEKLWEGLEFHDMVTTAEKWVKVIQEKEQPDMLIGMFHSGVDHTYESEDGAEYMNDNATRLVAINVPGFDVVLAGHDHMKVVEKVVNIKGDTVILLDARSHSRAVSFIDVDFNLDRKTGSYIKNIKADVVDIEDMQADSEFVDKFSNEFQTVKDYVNRQIGEFTKSMDSRDSYFGNSSFIDFIHNVQLDITQADVSLSSPLSFRTKIEKGPIYVSDLFKIYRYENFLYTMSFTGNEIDKYLEYSYSQWFSTMKNKNDHLLRIVENENGKWVFEKQYYNLSSAAGIDYLIDVTKPEGQKVRILGLSSGKRFYADSTYTVAVNSYRGNGGGGHFTMGAGVSKEELANRLIESSEYDIRYLIMNWIEDKEVIHTQKNSNWRVIPEDYYEKGKMKDRDLLFN